MSLRCPHNRQLNALVGKCRPSVRTCSIFLGLVTAIATPCLDVTAIKAESTVAQVPPDGQMSQMNRLYVNPSAGNDSNGTGDEQAPFQTITHALQVAQPNTAIVLAPGTYSTETGETFPLRLKAGVTIQGDRPSKGENIVILGGGQFLSRFFGGQNIAIAGANQAGLMGVTVTNPNPRGYGLWIESTNLMVVDNTFTGSNHDGIAVTGNSAPIIRNNYFSENGGNGMTIYGTSRPEVRENVFENTGFGISVGHNAAPQLIANRISGNKDGVVVETKATPVLRNNIIENNSRYGLVAISQARPDLGTAGEPGGNIFRANGLLDINTKASSQVIPAFGNQIAAKTEGRIDLTGMASQPTPLADAPVASGLLKPLPTASLPPQEALTPIQPLAGNGNSQLPLLPRPNLAILAPVQSAPTDSTGIGIPVQPPAPTSQPRRTSAYGLPTLQPPQQPRASSPLPISPFPRTTPLGIPDRPTVARSPLPTSPKPRASNTLPALPSSASTLPALPSPVLPRTLDFGVAPQEPLPASASSDLLPVPNPDVPLGNIGNSRTASGSGTPRRAGGSQPALGLRYRVVVDAQNSRQEALVRSLAPDAFRTLSNGRTVMQAGAFSTRDRALEMQQMLNSKGLAATIESRN
ncbi:DUF1565 domain-containing protein [Coleofasciculus sp. H7-2]|uniref:DUF1565 domain-containing protein n=1 Tax=Coleofasciculus sp. H7-2 TaxID=3351545 RepID=UPI00366D7D22